LQLVSSSEEVGVTVYRVTDGDTVRVSPEIEGEDAVRLIGVDTPETNKGGRGLSEPYAEEAKSFMHSNLQDSDVTLQFDAERKDDYGRLLAYVYLSDGTMFNETLLREGYAQVATFPPNTRYLNRFEEVQKEAREDGRGIWRLSEDELCRLRDRENGIGDC
jgi:micrococcal nuclease